jgi:hypothetical protein
MERQAVETAFSVLTDTDRRIGIMHAGFAVTALPHKATTEREWVRQGAGIKLRIESGKDAVDKEVGLPYGSIARMILLYLQTEAVRTNSRTVELGRSMHRWLTDMGIGTGGNNYRLVREQSRRLSLCKLTFYRASESGTQISNGSFVRDAILPPTGLSDQPTLWTETVTLDEGFYASLLAHPLPVREAAIREIAHRSTAIDIYIWLAYRLHRLEGAIPISWSALHEQFGAGYAAVRQFRAKFAEPLQLALAAYPEAHVSIDDTGLTLYPSPSPVTPRISKL